MKSGMRRLAATLAATTLAGGLAVLVAPAAEAGTGWPIGTQIGTATLAPVTGTDDDTLAVSTSAACPAAATYAQIYLYGAGFPSDGYAITANNPVTIFPTNSSTGGYDSIGTLDNLANFALAQTPPATYAGSYTISLVCKKSFGSADFGDFIGKMTFSDPHHYTSGVAVATATTLTASPAGTAVSGSAVTLTAAVTPAGAAGSVQFLDGATPLGTSTVTGTSATLSTSSLAVGSHSLTAVFTPTAPAGATPSTSAAVPYTITAALPVLSRPSALVLTVGTKFNCPNGAKETVPAAAIGKADACTEGGPFIVGSKGIAPVALVNPSLTGTGKVGSKLSLKPGLWTPAYTSRTVVWKRDGKVIAKAAGGTYTVTKADKGHKISATVTAHLAGHFDGTASTSGTKAKAIVAGFAPSIALAGATDTTANAKPISVPVGSIVGCVTGAFTGATTTTSAWFLDGAQVSTAIVVVIPNAAVGHTLVCRTTGTNAGGTVVSDATITVVPGAALLPYVQPRIAGTPKVGKKLAASAGKWYPKYAKATFVWLRNGAPIKGATKPTYVLGAADKKHKISVRVTVTLTGWTAAHAVSAAVSVG